MVFILVVLTVVIFIGVDFLLRREDKMITESTRSKKTPIFLSPDKALVPIEDDENKLYHISHTWSLSKDSDEIYIGYDDFISTIFSSDVNINIIHPVGTHILQGSAIWEVYSGNNRISQLAPLSGTVTEINPACTMNIPLSSKQTEKSWIVKIQGDNIKNETNNLMKHTQAKTINAFLRDELIMQAQQDQYLNDGGNIDPDYIKNMKSKEWNLLLDKFFPYHKQFVI